MEGQRPFVGGPFPALATGLLTREIEIATGLTCFWQRSRLEHEPNELHDALADVAIGQSSHVRNVRQRSPLEQLPDVEGPEDVEQRWDGRVRKVGDRNH